MFNYPIPVLNTKTTNKEELFRYVIDIQQNKERYKEFLRYRLPFVRKQAKIVYELIIENCKLPLG